MRIHLYEGEMELLKTVIIIDDDIERSLSAAKMTDGQFVLEVDDDLCQDMVDFIATEANHVTIRRRERDLDDLLDKILEQVDIFPL